jgi:DNA-binding beta-propeller fold protein YncE
MVARKLDTSSEPAPLGRTLLRPMRRGMRRVGIGSLSLVVALCVVLSGGFSLVGASHGPVRSIPAAATAGWADPLSRGAIAPSGPIGDRFFTATSVALTGVVNSASSLAVDPTTGTVYAANINAGTVTAFGEANGTLLRSAVVANELAGSFPFALSLDAQNGTLFVSVSNRYAGIGGPALPGWVLALDSATLAVRANYSFPGYPTPPFEPSFLAFDGATHQLFIENASGGTVAAVDVVAGAVRSYIDCGVMLCADHGYGLLDIPSLHDLIIPTCQPQLVVVSTLNDSVTATITGPPTAIMAWSAFDSRTGMLWVENYTFNRTNGTLLKVNLSSDQIVADIGGVEPREAAMVYDPAANLLVTSDVNGSEQLSSYNATTGARVASYTGGAGAAHPFKTLAVDAVHGIVIAGGPGNGTTRSFQLPGLSPRTTYSAFPASFAGVGFDPGRGIEVVVGTGPNELWGINESDGGTTYLTALPANATPTGMAVDPVAERAYVADATSGHVLVYDTGTGALSTTLHPLALGPIPGMLLSVDPTHHRLYVGDPSARAVSVLALPGGALLGTVPLPGVVGCALAADPPSDSAFVSNCGSVGNVTQVSGATLGRVGVTSVGPDPSALVANASGSVFVLDGTGTHVAILNVSATATYPGPGFSLVGGRATALAVDDRDGFLLATGGPSPRLSVFTIANRSFAGAVPLRSDAGSAAFDPERGIVVAPELGAGGVDEIGILAAPSAPTAVSVQPGNGSLQIAWGPPLDPGAAPVSGYRVAVGTPGSARSVEYNWTALSLPLINLTNGQSYVVRVSAYSPDGTGGPSPAVWATPAGVPYPPTNLTASLSDPTTLTLNWTAPKIDDGAPVTGYSVNVTGGPSARVLSLGDVQSATVSGLAAGASYRISVSAVSSAGRGNPSSAVVVSTPAAPFPWTEAIEIAVGVVAIAAVAGIGLRSRRRPRAPEPPDRGDGSG